MKLMERILYGKLKQQMEKNAGRKIVYRSFDEIKTVLLLYEAGMPDAAVCINTLLSEGKEVIQYVYNPSQKTKKTEQCPDHILSKAGLNMWGVPSASVRNRFAAMKADLLLDLTAPDCYAMKYLVVNHPASFKAGMNWNNDNYYDFAVSAIENRSITYLFDQILFYLQAIKSK